MSPFRNFISALLVFCSFVIFVGCSSSVAAPENPEARQPQKVSVPEPVVIALGFEQPPREREMDATVVLPASYPEVRQALDGFDEETLAETLEKSGVRGLLVARDLGDPQLLVEATLGNRLANYKPMEHLRAVRIDPQSALYEIVEPITLTEAEGSLLVALARAELGNTEKPQQLPSGLTKNRENVEVIVSFLGLQPLAQNNDRASNFRHQSFSALHTGTTLADATTSAAGRLREEWSRSSLQRREGNLTDALDSLWVEVEILYDRSPISMDNRELEIEERRRYIWQTIEIGVHGLEGSFDAQKYLLPPSSAVYHANINAWSFHRRIIDYFSENTAPNGYYRGSNLGATMASVRIERFRTIHFREMSPGGEVRRLHRGHLPREQSEITAEGLRQALRLASGWLTTHIQDDGLFEYKYYPTRDIFYREFHPNRQESHNIIRHGITVYALLMVARELPADGEPDDELIETATRALQPMLENTVIGPQWYENSALRRRIPAERRQRCRSAAACELPEECIDGYCRLPFGAPLGTEQGRHLVMEGQSWTSYDGIERPLAENMMYLRWKDVAKMGSVAAVVMALTELIDLRPDLLDRHRAYLEGYAAFLRFMQRPDGSFNCYFTAPSDGRYYAQETYAYPGEILFALSRLYRLLGDAEILDAFNRGHQFYSEWFRRGVQNVNPDGTYEESRRYSLMGFISWFTMACRDMYLQTGRSEIGEIAVEAADWLAENYQFSPERTSFPDYIGSYRISPHEQPSIVSLVYSEATAESFDLARRMGRDDVADRLRLATLRSCRFGLSLIVRPGIDDHYFPGERARRRSRGGVRYGLTVSHLRVDHSYHVLSTMARTLRYFQDEDWTIDD